MPTSEYRTAVIADGPVFYAPLDSGSPLVDLRSTNSLTAFNTPTAPGDYNDGYTFEDSAEEYLYIAAEDCYDVGQWIMATGQFTIECWLKVPTPTFDGASRVIRWGWYGLFLQTYRFNGNVSGYITAGFTDSGAIERNVEDNDAYFNGFYHHVVCTYDGADLTLYVDEDEVATQSRPQGILIADTAAQDGLGIGRDGPFDQSYFEGSIDEVAIYNYPLTTGQISAHFAADRVEEVGDDPEFGDPEGELRTPPEGTASSFHAGWDTDFDTDGLVKEVMVDLRILKEPVVDDLYFWALQASFYGTTGLADPLGGGHTGLQWNSEHPSNRAVNWGGYDDDDVILTGSESAFPSTPDNDNTRDYDWELRETYTFRIWISDTDVVAASVNGVLIRELDVPGVTWLHADAMWSEVFAECSAPSALCSWGNFKVVDDTDTEFTEDTFNLTYQLPENDGCSNTDTYEYGNSVRQKTNTTRTNP